MNFRNAVFAASLTIWTILVSLFFLPLLALPGKRAFIVGRVWAHGAMFLTRWLAGISFEVRGREYLPQGACIVAPKHQSPWDTFVLHMLLPNPAIALKRELTKVPFFGWYLRKSGAIPLDREAGSSAMRELLRNAREAAAGGHPLVIFPEGTRVVPGQAGDYKPGVAGIYSQLKVPVVPVALNSGLVWPARGWALTPGHIVWEFLPAIPPGLPRPEFMRRLEQEIEAATNKLVDNPPCENRG